MAEFEQRFKVSASPDEVWAFHRSTDALRKLTPPGVIIQLHRSAPVEEGSVARFTLWFGPFPVRWTARHERVDAQGFDDVQAEGPMARWRHSHRFLPTEDGTEIVDRISYEHPGGARGIWTRLLFGRLPLTLNFAFRRWVTQRALGT